MLQMSDHQDFAFWINAGMAVLNVGLNWVLIQEYGVVGAAVATGLTHALGNLLQLVGLYLFVHIQPFRWNLWKPLAAAVASSCAAGLMFALFAPPSRWIVGIPAAVLVYTGALLFLGLAPRDQTIVNGLWNELRSRVQG
jgi:O-antigen/teichoic acid export membrane protein